MATSIATFQAILKFCATKNLFKYFRKRYNSEQLKELNNVVKIRGKIRTVKLSTEFLDDCKTHHVVPSFIGHRIKAAKVQQTSTMERAFLQDEIGKNSTKLRTTSTSYLYSMLEKGT